MKPSAEQNKLLKLELPTEMVKLKVCVVKTTCQKLYDNGGFTYSALVGFSYINRHLQFRSISYFSTRMQCDQPDTVENIF